MAQNKVEITQQDGGLGRRLPSDDHVAALLFDHVAQPANWGTTKMRYFRSIRALEESGVLEHDLFYGSVHYQVKEYFRLHGKGEVYVGFEITKTGTAETQAQAIKSSTEGRRVRQFGVFDSDHTNTSKYQALMGELEGIGMDAVVIMGVDAPVYFNAISDLFTRVHNKVHVVISGDGDNLGASYASALGITYLPAVGAALGALSRSGVQESHAHVDKFNMSEEKELANPVFSNGTLLKDTLQAYLDELHDKGWGFLRTYEGIAGTRWDDNRTAMSLTSDYSSLNINRTAQKAVRLVRAKVTPEISGGVKTDATTGYLSIGYVEFLKGLIEGELFEMEKAGELSGGAAIIDPTQDIQATSKIVATIELVPIGISRGFKFDLTFTPKLSS